MGKYKNVIFDLGGVILNQDPEAMRQRFGQLGLSLEPRFHIPFITEYLQRRQNKKIMAFIDGFIPESRVIPAIQRRCAPGTTEAQVREALELVISEIPQSRLEMLCQLRQTHKVYLLSNLNEMYWLQTLHLMQQMGYTPEQCFDRTFISYQMQLAKPDPRIFAQLIEETGINPTETVYFDDIRQNIVAGSKAGFTSFLVRTNHIEDMSSLLESI